MQSLLYVCEQWPNPYKPTWDLQIQALIGLGIKVSIVQCGHDQPKYSQVIKDHIKKGRISRYHYPATLKDLPRQMTSARFILNILLRLSLLPMLWRQRKSAKDKWMDYFRLCALPQLQYDYVLVKNLNCAADYVFIPDVIESKTLPTVYYHGGAVEGVPPLYLKQCDQIFERYGLFFTNTQYSKRELENLGASPAKVHAIPVGLQISANLADTKTYRPEGVLRLLTSSRLSAEKGVIYAIKAIESLVRSGTTNIRYDIVGNGSEENYLRKYVEENGLSQWIVFHGRQPNDKVNTLFMTNADVLLNTCYPTGTWAETQCVAVQEAGLALVPSIASHCGGLPEVIVNRVAGVLVEVKSVASIAQAIKYMAEMDVATMAEMGRAAQRLVKDKFDVNNVTRSMMEVVSRRSISYEADRRNSSNNRLSRASTSS